MHSNGHDIIPLSWRFATGSQNGSHAASLRPFYSRWHDSLLKAPLAEDQKVSLFAFHAEQRLSFAHQASAAIAVVVYVSVLAFNRSEFFFIVEQFHFTSSTYPETVYQLHSIKQQGS